jgi:hypothetical protein
MAGNERTNGTAKPSPQFDVTPREAEHVPEWVADDREARPRLPTSATRSVHLLPHGMARVRMMITAVGGGILFGLIVVLTLLTVSNRGRLSELTPTRFYEAQQQWAQTGPSSYDIRVIVSGRQAATYEVQVRDGTVIGAMRDGYPLTQQRTWATWSVPGMFGTILSDVRHLEQHQNGTATAETPDVQLRAHFEPTYGYPQRYYRSESSRWQANQEVSWEVVSFRVVTAEQSS